MANIASVLLKTESAQIVVMAHNKNPLSNEEWEENYLAHIRELKRTARIDDSANLVFAEGQGPTSKQRSVGNQIFGKNEHYQFRVAVVTGSTLVRGAVTALSWFNPLIKAYSAEDYRGAFQHVRLRPIDDERVRQALIDLKQKIGDVELLNEVVRRFGPPRAA